MSGSQGQTVVRMDETGNRGVATPVKIGHGSRVDVRSPAEPVLDDSDNNYGSGRRLRAVCSVKRHEAERPETGLTEVVSSLSPERHMGGV